MKRIVIMAERRFSGALLAAAASFVMSGCINDSSPCLPEEEGAEVTMEFSIVTRGIRTGDRSGGATRVTDADAPDAQQIGTPAENYLDIPNLAFLLFDDSGNLITPFYPVVKEENDTYKKYNVTCRIPQDVFDYATGTDVSFFVMVLANYSGNNPSRFNFSNGIDMERLFSMDSSGTCDFHLKKSSDNYDYWWSPSITYKQFIPMSGMRKFTVTRQQLLASNPTNPLQLSSTPDKEINMLRSIAKIEIIDKIEYDAVSNSQPDITNRISVEKAELLGYFDKISVLPSQDNWLPDETDYVSTPSIPSNASYVEPKSYEVMHPSDESIAPGNQNGKAIVDFYYDDEATKARTDKCRVFSTYVSEYDNAKATDGGKTPAWIAVTIMINNQESDNNPIFELKLAPYTDNTPGATMNILRNNIYRYEINSAGLDSQITLNWTVCPMDEVEVNIPPFE